MPYALFESDERLTRPFRTEREVWEAAERADLITIGTHGEKILDNNFEIKPCDAAPEELVGSGRLIGSDGEIIFPERRSEPDAPIGPFKESQTLPPRVKTETTSS